MSVDYRRSDTGDLRRSPSSRDVRYRPSVEYEGRDYRRPDMESRYHSRLGCPEHGNNFMIYHDRCRNCHQLRILTYGSTVMPRESSRTEDVRSRESGSRETRPRETRPRETRPRETRPRETGRREDGSNVATSIIDFLLKYPEIVGHRETSDVIDITP